MVHTQACTHALTPMPPATKMAASSAWSPSVCPLPYGPSMLTGIWHVPPSLRCAALNSCADQPRPVGGTLAYTTARCVPVEGSLRVRHRTVHG